MDDSETRIHALVVVRHLNHWAKIDNAYHLIRAAKNATQLRLIVLVLDCRNQSFDHRVSNHRQLGNKQQYNEISIGCHKSIILSFIPSVANAFKLRIKINLTG